MTGPVGERITLSATEFDVLWRAGHDEPLPAVIDVPSPGATNAERAELLARVQKTLRAKDILTRDGVPRRAVRDALDAIAGRRVAIELRARLPYEFRAMLAVAARGAVIVAVVADEVRLQPVRDTGIAATMALVLPHVPAGPGHSVTVEASVFAQLARAPSHERRALLVRSGLRRDDVRVLLDAIDPIERIGQFGVTTATGQLDRVVGFHDTPRGRYQVIRRITEVTDYLTIVPATQGTLAVAIDELMLEADGSRQPVRVSVRTVPEAQGGECGAHQGGEPRAVLASISASTLPPWATNSLKLG